MFGKHRGSHTVQSTCWIELGFWGRKNSQLPRAWWEQGSRDGRCDLWGLQRGHAEL